jgi:hypothetical protein
MNNKFYIGIIIFLLIMGGWYFRPKPSPGNLLGNNMVLEDVKPDLSLLPQVYKNDFYKFKINLPSDFVVDEKYRYESTPEKSFPGIKFKIPKRLYEGTNLSSDSYISIEYAYKAPDACLAQIFLDSSEIRGFADFGKHRYNVAYSVGAGAGNIYEETVYATAVDGGCLALRYFIHYGVYENYPEGSIKKFDEDALKKLFDTIRVTLSLN